MHKLKLIDLMGICDVRMQTGFKRLRMGENKYS